MLENEIKLCLTQENYHEIKNIFFNNNDFKKILQINYYYDNDNNELYKNNITLRIRQINDTLTLEAKYPLENNGIIKRKEERSVTLHNFTNSIDLNNSYIKEYIGDVSQYGRVKLLGSLVTERYSTHPYPWLKLNLDYSMYLGKVDYELEIEVLSGYENEAKEFYKDLLSKYPLSTSGKIKRFRKALSP